VNLISAISKGKTSFYTFREQYDSTKARSFL
jgi:hypothetical protein